MDQVIFYEEVQKVLCKTACEWVGVPIEEGEVDKRTKDLASLFESAVAVGPAYWSGRNSRKSLDKWIGELIEGIRDEKINVHDDSILYRFRAEVQTVLCKTACEWVGVPIEEGEVDKRTKDLESLFESAVAVGPAYWSGRNSRKSLDKWIGELIEGIRDEKINVHDDSILYRFDFHRDLEGNYFNKETAAVEVINLLRPIVAISIFINFLFLAIHHYAEKKEKVQSDDEQYLEMFVQETRRFYPFFPFVAALVKKDFLWGDYQFKEGVLTILDIYGTNHDPDLWEEPNLFNPKRFANWERELYKFIPQGGGDYWMGHRCAGEWVTVKILKLSLS